MQCKPTAKSFLSLLLIYAGAYCLQHANPYGAWENGPPSDSTCFPIAVWLQSPGNAAQYRQAGINLYIGLWQGPTEDQLNDLRQAGMPVICHQNSVGLQHLDDSLIIGWSQQDEPDNAQADGQGGYDPCIDPDSIVNIYNDIKAKDPGRPVYLNLGQGVSYTDWVGRGTCTGRTDMYPEYIKGADIISFDIYPVVNSADKIKGNLWYVPRGIDSLRLWSNYRKPVWCWIECTHINSQAKPTPKQVKGEVWMALIHGAQGFGYFCHEWVPSFNESALLDDAAMLEAVTALNKQIHELAPVLNSTSITNQINVSSSNSSVPVDIMVKNHAGFTYVFAVSMREGDTKATFSGVGGSADVTVIGENRSLTAASGSFEDSFSDYEVHLYKFAGTSSSSVSHRASHDRQHAFRGSILKGAPPWALHISGKAIICSLSGKQLRELHSSPNGQILWDGADSRGRTVTNSMLFAIIDKNERRIITPLTVIR
jgi:hypothetical protein